MGLFDRRVTKAGPQNAGFEETLLGTAYKAVWRDKTANLPDPGAQAFAYETLGLVAFPPSGPSIVANAWRMHAFYSSPSVSRAAVRTIGIPTVAGQIFSQPLLDPYNKPVGGQV
jgi:hypothetical protein